MIINNWGNKLTVVAEKSIYTSDVLHKCFYWYGAMFHVTISEKDISFYEIELYPKFEDVVLEDSTSKIKRDLIDFKLRDTVNKETRTIRDLIIAKAFAYYEERTSPDTELSDPVGFDPFTI